MMRCHMRVRSVTLKLPAAFLLLRPLDWVWELGRGVVVLPLGAEEPQGLTVSLPLPSSKPLCVW